MNLLYGVVGEGMGHATRSEAVIRHLLARGHRLVILASGKAEPYLRAAFRDEHAVRVDEIRGLFMKYAGNRVDRLDTVISLLRSVPSAAVINFRELQALNAIDAIPEQAFDAVVTDFETMAHRYGRWKGLPVINIDNMSIITRCDHRALHIPAQYGFDRLLAAAITEAKVHRSTHYLVTTFFYPPLRPECADNTFLFPPILRGEIFHAGRQLRTGTIIPGDELLVYHTSATFVPLLDALETAGISCNVYGFDPAQLAGTYRHLRIKPRDREQFFADFTRAAAVVTGGGFSLMSEAVHLGKPVLSLPLDGQFEQTLNALYLEQLGYGMHCDGKQVARDPGGFRAQLATFHSRLPEYRANLAQYTREHPQQDNSALLAKLDGLLAATAG